VQPTAVREQDRAKVILVHEPGPELLSALLWPKESSFEKSFDSRTAVLEHRQFCEELTSRGITVHRLTELLASFGNLKDLAARHVKRVGRSLPTANDAASILENLCPDDLVRILLERPTVEVDPSAPSSPVLHSRPLSNLYFMRDQMITTDRGVVLGRFKRPVRQPEREIVRAALEALGVAPIFEIDPPGILEGGDFMPFGEWALIGIGARSNQDAVEQLCTLPGANSLGYKYLAVVNDPEKDPLWQQQEMHLDTYFAIVGSDTCLVEITRIGDAQGMGQVPSSFPSLGADRVPSVDIYQKAVSGEYSLAFTEPDFGKFLRVQLGMKTIVPLFMEDQIEYGCNVLCTAPNTLIGSYSQEQASTSPMQLLNYRRALKIAHLDASLIDFTHIRRGYGSNHCMTQVLVREP
jgi:arginine deiminase